jgi:hypothetical protein
MMMGGFFIQLVVIMVHMNGKGSKCGFSMHGLTIKLSKNQLEAVAFNVHSFQSSFHFLICVRLLRGAFGRIELQKMGPQLEKGNA